MSQYKKIVIIGATSGIGLALADRFAENGAFVIAVGRRKENLQAFVEKHGHNKAQAVTLDITQVESIGHFAINIMSTHPDVDCIMVNAGIQRSINFAEPDTIDMKVIGDEITTNYTSQVALAKAFLPYLLKKETPTSFVFTTSGLAIVPMPRVPNYCASKAAMHTLTMCMREQLRDSKVKIIELLPPAVQTELHDAKHQPDLKDAGPIGMPLKDFTDEAWAKLSTDTDYVAVEMAQKAFDAVEPARQERFGAMVQRMRGS